MLEVERGSLRPVLGNRFEARRVELGKAIEGRTEIVSGLDAGTPIVVEGSFHLKAIVVGKDLGEE